MTRPDLVRTMMGAIAAAAALLASLPFLAHGATPMPITLDPPVASYLESREAEFGDISTDRCRALDALADHIRERLASTTRCDLIFICTHNSRRSHMGQVWAAAAAARFGVTGITAYSGGTESTAFNPRAVEALRRAGVRIDKTTDAANPIYLVRFAEGASPVTCFSKRFGDPPNPASGFVAVMTCSDAAEKCPVVAGAEARFAIPYEDPKAYDGEKLETRAYDDRCAQIAREMLYVFARVAG